MKIYKHIFFDLDRTLWDYDANSTEALQEIYSSFNLADIYAQFSDFHHNFEKYNDHLWTEFREGRVQKSELRVKRFELTLLEARIENRSLAEELNKAFLKSSPRKTKLIDGAAELLDYLQAKRYKLYIITNGFTRIQKLKIESSKIDQYFIRMFTSDNINAHKPKREMFARSVSWSNARKADCLMVGDDLALDIVGARNYGIDQAYLNPKQTPHREKVTYEIQNLKELMSIL